MNWQQRYWPPQKASRTLWHPRGTLQQALRQLEIKYVGMVGSVPRALCPATEAEIHWPWKLRTKKPPLEKSLWNLSRTWLVELYAVSRAVFPLKTPSWGEFWSGPSLGKRVGHQRKKFSVIAETVQPVPQYGQEEYRADLERPVHTGPFRDHAVTNNFILRCTW